MLKSKLDSYWSGSSSTNVLRKSTELNSGVVRISIWGWLSGAVPRGPRDRGHSEISAPPCGPTPRKSSR